MVRVVGRSKHLLVCDAGPRCRAVMVQEEVMKKLFWRGVEAALYAGGWSLVKIADLIDRIVVVMKDPFGRK